MLRLRRVMGASQKQACESDSKKSDLLTFWAIMTSDAVMRVLVLVRLITLLSFGLFFFSWHLYHLLMGCIGVSVSLAEGIIIKKLEKRPVFLGCAIQLSFHVYVAYAAALMYPSLPGEVYRHRMYLTSTIPIFLISTVAGYLPPLVFGLGACPIFFGSWLTFHYKVGFLTPQCVVWGMAFCISTAYVSLILDKRDYKLFRTTQELENERSSLEASQVTLQAMLSSIFDASAFCDSGGSLFKVTPQLQGLLGDGGQLHSTCLLDHASSPTERERLVCFLENATQTAVHQAAKIQVMLKHDITSSQGTASSAIEECSCQSSEVNLYAIKLARPSTPFSSPEQLFLGFQVHRAVERSQLVQSVLEHRHRVQSTQESLETSRHESEAWSAAPDPNKHILQQDTCEDASESVSAASSWSLSPSEFVTTDTPEISRISFVVDPWSDRFCIRRITFDFIDAVGDGRTCLSPPGMADFMPVRAWDCFQGEAQECMNAVHAGAEQKTFSPVFLQLPSHLTGAHEVLLRADRVSMELPLDERMEKPAQHSAADTCESATEEDSGDSSDYEETTRITFQLEGFVSVAVPSVNPKRLLPKRHRVRQAAQQEMPVILESIVQ